jgi:hypothetical protein
MAFLNECAVFPSAPLSRERKTESVGKGSSQREDDKQFSLGIQEISVFIMSRRAFFVHHGLLVVDWLYLPENPEIPRAIDIHGK